MQERILSFFRRHSVKVLVIIAFVAGASATNKYFEISKNLDIYSTLFKEVNELYVEEINTSRLMREGIDAMLKSLDPYTSFISESEIEDFRFMTTGQYGGIGASVSRRGDYVIISEVYEGFPADESGLLAGDRLVRVGEMDVKGKSTSEVSEVLKGQPGSVVEVEVKREGEDVNLTFDVTRKQVQISNVPFYGLVDENTGYIKLSSFRQGATNEVRDAFIEMKNEHNIEGLILDLRDNPGGLLSESVNMVNLFVPRGEVVVSTRGRIKEWENEYRSRNEPVDTEMPLIVLVNGNSASASEIVAGAMQDFDRGVVIGRNTVGKGTVQTTRSLSYNTQLKITTAKYYIPSGRSIERLEETVDDDAIIKSDPARPVEFTTRNGRIVRESNGILPDIETQRQTEESFVNALRRNHKIFDFATRYHRENESIPPADEFEIDETIYSSFKSYVLDSDFEYHDKLGNEFNDFVNKATERDNFSQIQDHVNAIRDQLEVNLEKELNENREQISRLLAGNIVLRYYYRTGRIEASFRKDEDVVEARNVLHDLNSYEGILTAAE